MKIQNSRLVKKITRPHLEKFIKEHQDRGLTLDIGCGRGLYAKYFPNRVGFDIQSGQADVIGDAHKLPFKDGEFDNILCTEVLEHLHSPKVAISEMRRVLKTGGKLILTTRFIFPLHDIPHDYYRFTKYGLRHLLKDWEILELREETTTLEGMAVLVQRIGYQCDFHLRVLKVPLFLFAKLLVRLSFLVVREFGDVSKKNPEQNIITSGYYLVCRKEKALRKEGTK